MAVTVTVTVVIVTAAAPIDDAPYQIFDARRHGGERSAGGQDPGRDCEHFSCDFLVMMDEGGSDNNVVDGDSQLFLTQLGWNIYLTRSLRSALASSVVAVFDSCTQSC